MPDFVYKAKKGPGEVIERIITAGSNEEAVAKILKQGQTPVEIKLQPVTGSLSQTQKNRRSDLQIGLDTVFLLTRQLADMLEAGIPLLRGLEILMRQKQKPSVSHMILSLHRIIKEGGSLSSALSLYPRVFAPFHIHMVKSGELSGHLSEALDRLSNFMEEDLKIQTQIRNSLLYPAIVLVVGLLTIFVLFSFVLPRLTIMFNDLDAVLPLPTRMVIAASGIFANLWWLMLILISGLIHLFRNSIRNEAGRLYWDNLLLKVPVLREFIKNIETARFARTMGTLLENGVAISSALDSVSPMIHNGIIRNAVQSASRQVREGKSLTAALKSSDVLPDMAINLISVGEESGHVGKSLNKLADIYERAATQTAQNFVTILGPAILVVIVAFIGFIVIAMLLPMFRMDMIIH